MIELLDELKNLKKTVKCLRLDDAGEKFALERPVSNTILGCSLSLDMIDLVKDPESFDEAFTI
jgi:hypothetical protein